MHVLCTVYRQMKWKTVIFLSDKRGQTKWKHAWDDQVDTDLARHCSLPVIPFNPDVLRSRIIPDELSGIESSCPLCLRPARSKVSKAVWHIMSSHHRWDLTLLVHRFTPIYIIIQKGLFHIHPRLLSSLCCCPARTSVILCDPPSPQFFLFVLCQTQSALFLLSVVPASVHTWETFTI